jgi:hypothetical protein
MIDDLVERLRDWPYQGETMALQAADEITALRARVAEVGKERDDAVIKRAAWELEAKILTAKLATARADALEEAAKWLRGGAHLPYPMLADEMIRAMKDAKP